MKRRDSGFFTFGELCRYLRKLCSRAILPKHTPADNDWSGLLQLSLDDCRELSCRDFLSRLKLKFDLEAASEAKAKKENSGKKNLTAVLSGLTEAVRDTFAAQARSYIVFVFDSLLKDIQLTAGIVRGLGSFDLTVLQTQPMEQALFCFRALFHSFQIRGWVQENPSRLIRFEGRMESFLHHWNSKRKSHFLRMSLLWILVESSPSMKNTWLGWRDGGPLATHGTLHRSS